MKFEDSGRLRGTEPYPWTLAGIPVNAICKNCYLPLRTHIGFKCRYVDDYEMQSRFLRIRKDKMFLKRARLVGMDSNVS